jgi:hypothetical protein
VVFWRALAGMGFALAIGAVIVAAEFSSALIRRTHWMARRITHLSAENRHLKSRIGIADQKLTTTREALANDAALKRILTAPDLRVIKLSAAGSVTTAPGASAIIAISDTGKSAMLQATGLAPSPEGHVYRLWWILRRGAPVSAGRFRAAASGSATVAIAPAPKGVASAAITQEDASATGPPAGAPILRSAAIR